MIRTYTLVPLSLLVACVSGDGDPGVPTYPAVPRPERESLLAHMDRLGGLDVETLKEGAFAMRVAGHREAPDRSMYPRAVAAAGPGGPSSPGRGRRGSSAVTTGSDAFYMGGPRGVTDVTAARPTATLRAGTTDDNLHFDEYLDYLQVSRKADRLQGRYVDLDVGGRSMLQVVDVSGAPVPGVELRVVDDEGEKLVWRGTTYGDGSVPFYPAVAVEDGGNGGPYLVEVPVGERVVRHSWMGDGDTVVRLPRGRAEGAVTLDVAFVVDTTGSMGDEIAAIKASLLGVTARLRDLEREFELRYAAVLYRDMGDKYVTAVHEFTEDIEAFDRALQEVVADGGGDGPESLNQALAVAVDGLEWGEGAARVAFVIADARPHLDYEGDVAYDLSLRAAVARGIRMHTVAASGLDEAGSLVFRQVAQFTRGEFVFVEYGGDVKASGEVHGVSAPVEGNNLDEILFTRIRNEIARWGRGQASQELPSNH